MSTSLLAQPLICRGASTSCRRAGQAHAFETPSVLLIHVVRERGTLPARMRVRLRLDSTSDATVEELLPPLIATLREPAPSSN